MRGGRFSLLLKGTKRLSEMAGKGPQCCEVDGAKAQAATRQMVLLCHVMSCHVMLAFCEHTWTRKDSVGLAPRRINYERDLQRTPYWQPHDAPTDPVLRILHRICHRSQTSTCSAVAP